MIKSHVKKHVDLIVSSMIKMSRKFVKYGDRHDVENTKQSAKFVIFYAYFKVHRKYQILAKIYDFRETIPIYY